MKRISLICLIFCFVHTIIKCQEQKQSFLLTPEKVFLGETIIYAGTMIGLNALWYKNYEHSGFHWFDDRKEWLQMDKLGHGFSAYYMSNISTALFRQTKWTNNKITIIYGSLTAWFYISTVEIFDGFSSKWGASYSDLIANTLGTGIFTFQALQFGKQIIVPKFSFHQTHYSQYRPDALGKNMLQNLLKDYNGQTYWLSVNIRDVSGSEKIPRWLNFAIGYSANGMLGGIENPQTLPYYKRTRQFFLSMDVSFKKITVRSKCLKQIFNLINVIKIPFPSLIMTNNQLKFSLFYF